MGHRTQHPHILNTGNMNTSHGDIAISGFSLRVGNVDVFFL